MKKSLLPYTVRPTKPFNILQDYFQDQFVINTIAPCTFTIQIYRKVYRSFSRRSAECLKSRCKEQKRVDLNIILGKLSTLSLKGCI